MLCPDCAYDNIPGNDLCDKCGLDLAGLDVKAWGLSSEDPMLSMPLSALPLKEPITLEADATVSKAIELLTERREGCVIVREGDDPVAGIFTERDATARVFARQRDPRELKLSDVMTRNPYTLQKDDALAFALHRMGVDGFRHLPVLDEGRVIGFLSMRTVLGALAQA